MSKLFYNYNAWDPFELFPIKEIEFGKSNKVGAGLNPDSALAMNKRAKDAIKQAEAKLIEDKYIEILGRIKKESDKGNFYLECYYDELLYSKYLIIMDRLQKMGYTVVIMPHSQFENVMTIKW